jgi:hypothetical protein
LSDDLRLVDAVRLLCGGGGVDRRERGSARSYSAHAL